MLSFIAGKILEESDRSQGFGAGDRDSRASLSEKISFKSLVFPVPRAPNRKKLLLFDMLINLGYIHPKLYAIFYLSER